MSTITRTTRHSFRAYSFNGDTVLTITQFSSDDFEKLRILSDMSVHLNSDELKKLIETLQEAK